VEGSLEAGGVSISDPSDQHEQAAEQTAQAVLTGEAVTLGSSGQSGVAATPVQRWEWGDVATEAAWGAMGALPGLGGIAQFGRGVYDRYQSGSALPQGTARGVEPSATDPGAYAYQKHNEQGGVETGMGAFHGEGDIGGIPVTDDILTIDEKTGAWGDNGGTRYGYNLGGGVTKLGFNKGGAVSGDVGAGTFGLDASINPDQGLSVGAQANILEGSMTFGNFTGEGDTAEESLRLGLSAGEGYAGRLHWGDSDKDKHREYGFGFDAGPFSMDIKTEDPVRTALKAGVMMNPATAVLSPLLGFLPDGNMTDTAGEYAGAAWNTASGLAGDAWDAAGSAYDTASDYAGSAYDTVSDYAGSAYDTASDYAGAAWDTAGSAYDTASDYAGSAYDTASDYAGSAWDTAGDVAGGAYDTVSDAASSAWDWATDW
jgi:hypothetical protein